MARPFGVLGLVFGDVAIAVGSPFTSMDLHLHNLTPISAGCVEAESPKTLNPALSKGETMSVSASERIMVKCGMR